MGQQPASQSLLVIIVRSMYVVSPDLRARFVTRGFPTHPPQGVGQQSRINVVLSTTGQLVAAAKPRSECIFD